MGAVFCSHPGVQGHAALHQIGVDVPGILAAGFPVPAQEGPALRLAGGGRGAGPYPVQQVCGVHPLEPKLAGAAVGIFHQPGDHVAQPPGLLPDGLRVFRGLLVHLVRRQLDAGELGIAGDHGERGFQLVGHPVQKFQIHPVHPLQHLAPAAALDEGRLPLLDAQAHRRSAQEHEAQHAPGRGAVVAHVRAAAGEQRLVQQAGHQHRKAAEHQRVGGLQPAPAHAGRIM